MTNDADATDCVDCQSYMDFGAPDDAVINGQEIVWLDVVENDNGWTNYISGFKWGNDESPILYQLGNLKAYTDTGTSCISGPTSELLWIKKQLLQMITSYSANTDWGEVFSCNEIYLLPSFYLLLGDYWFPVNPRDYVVEVSTDGQCSFCFTMVDTTDYWVLGTAFLRGWYSMYDYSTY
jgi:hypothetical protein